MLQASGLTFSVQEHVPIIGQADVERELGLPVDQLLKTMVSVRETGPCWSPCLFTAR